MSDSHPPEERKPLCRRRFVAMLMLAGGGLYFQREPEAAESLFTGFRRLLESVPVSLGPEPETSAPPTAYSAFLATLGLEHIAISTVIAPHFNRHGSVKNTLPPERLWKNIIPTLRVVDTLARELGGRLRIDSAYRSLAYNATCPGAARWSQHLRNAALDIRFSSPPIMVAALARKLRTQGLFRGGVGLYPAFTHIDTRGQNTDW